MWLLDTRHIRSFDWISFLIMLIFMHVGLICVFSATYQPEMPYSLFFKKQLFGIISGIIIYFIFCWLDYRTLERTGYFLYFATMMLLLITIVKGSIGMGAQRWINLGVTKFQPSELTKLFFPAFLAIIYSPMRMTRINQPSLISSRSLRTWNKRPAHFKTTRFRNRSHCAFLGSSFIVAGRHSQEVLHDSNPCCVLTAPLIWKCLKPYQRNRITVFLGQGDRQKRALSN